MILKDLLVGILKHCCCAKTGAASLRRYQICITHNCTFSIVNTTRTVQEKPGLLVEEFKNESNGELRGKVAEPQTSHKPQADYSELTSVWLCRLDCLSRLVELVTGRCVHVGQQCCIDFTNMSFGPCLQRNWSPEEEACSETATHEGLIQKTLAN